MRLRNIVLLYRVRLRTRLAHELFAILRHGFGLFDLPFDREDRERADRPLHRACEENERLALTYRDRDGRLSERRVEPFRLVATGRRWYLLSYDLDRNDWRTLRLDRVEAAVRTGHRSVVREPPDPVSFVGGAITSAPYRYQATVQVAASVDELRRKVPPTVGLVQPAGVDSLLLVGGQRLDWLCGFLVALELPFEVLDPPELREHLARLGRQLTATHGGRTPASVRSSTR